MVFAATAVSNALVYLAIIAASRSLGPAEYGIVGAMIGAIVILTVPSLSLQTLAAREAAALRSRGDDAGVAGVHQRRLRQAVLFGAVATALAAAFSEPIARLLNFPDLWPVLLTAFAAAPILVTSETRGVLQGQERFGPLCLNLIVEGVVRLAAVAVALAAGRGATGVCAAPAIGTAASAAAGLWALRGLARPEGAARAALTAVWATGAFYAGYAALTNIDVVVAKQSFSDVDAGHYAAAAIFGKVVLLLPLAVGIVLLPRVAAAAEEGRRGFRLLARALVLVVGACGAVTLVGYLAPHAITLVTVGSEYVDAEDLYGPYGVAMLGFAVVAILVLFNLAHGRPVTAWACLVAAPVQFALMALVADTGTELIWTMVGAAAAIAAIGAAEAALTPRRPPAAPPP